MRNPALRFIDINRCISAGTFSPSPVGEGRDEGKIKCKNLYND